MNKRILFDRNGKSIAVRFYALLILAVMCFASCSEGDDPGTAFTSDVQNTTLSSPESISFSLSTNDTTLTISWPVVYGAGGYTVTFYNVDDPDNPVVIGTENDTIDGCSATRIVGEDSKYKAVVQTLGNAKYNNLGADSATTATYTTLVTSYTTIPDGTDLYVYFTENPMPTDSTSLVYDLVAGGSYSMSGDVSIPYLSFMLRGDKVDHPTITMTSGVFISEGNTTKLKFIDFECSGFVGSGLLTLNATPSDSLFTGGGYYATSPMAVQSCQVMGLTVPLIYDGGGKYAIEAFTISDCIVEQNTSSAYLIDAQHGFVNDMNIANSTIYNVQSDAGGYMIKYLNNAYYGRVTGTSWSSTNITITSSTFWQVCDAKQMLNGGSLTRSQNTLTVTSCIFVDCGSAQVIRRLGGGRPSAMTRVMGYNSYWYDGAFSDGEVSDSYDNSTTYITDDPSFVDAANGDFTPQGAGQVDNQTGDPRWFE